MTYRHAVPRAKSKHTSIWSQLAIFCVSAICLIARPSLGALPAKCESELLAHPQRPSELQTAQRHTGSDLYDLFVRFEPSGGEANELFKQASTDDALRSELNHRIEELSETRSWANIGLEFRSTVYTSVTALIRASGVRLSVDQLLLPQRRLYSSFLGIDSQTKTTEKPLTYLQMVASARNDTLNAGFIDPLSISEHLRETKYAKASITFYETQLAQYLVRSREGKVKLQQKSRIATRNWIARRKSEYNALRTHNVALILSTLAELDGDNVKKAASPKS